MWPFTRRGAPDIGLTEDEADNLATIGARFDTLIAEGPLTRKQRKAFDEVIDRHPDSMGKQARRLREYIERMLDGDDIPLDDEDPWALAARADLAAIANRPAWIALLATPGDGAKPTKKWLALAAAQVATIGAGPYVDTVRAWFARVAPRPVVRDQHNWYTPAMVDTNSEALRNLVWACATLPGDQDAVAVVIGDLAVRCFTKIKGVGALSTKAGNACIWVLSQLPGMRAVAQLARLGARIRYRQAVALVDKAKLEAARRAGMEPADLEELALPMFGLDVEGKSRIQLGDHVAELATDGVDVTLAYYAGAKRLKSVPTAVKAEHADELKELKATHKELAEMVPTLRYRLERWLAEPRRWTLADLRTRYLDHPLAARLARRLIYTGDATVIFIDGYPVDVTGKQVPLADDAQLELWHPLGRPADEVAAWRATLAALGVTQPIKQLERELYPPDEDGESRFANRVMRQHQFAALCRERGWSYRLQGQFDSQNNATKLLLAHGLEIELEIEPADEEAAPSGIFVRVRTGDVRFLRDRRPVPLHAVPPRCYSEILRDVDMFVTVCA
ncbi:MAG: DUF4132 domain-containing protein [Kofleriaceae bacterium]